MSLRDDLAKAAARDCRFHWKAYLFIFEALEFTKERKQRTKSRSRDRRKAVDPYEHHVTGRALCEGARDLAIQQYGMLAPTVLGQWGIRSTSDLGEIVFNLIASGDLEKTPTDNRVDFNDVYDFATAFSQFDVLTIEPEN